MAGGPKETDMAKRRMVITEWGRPSYCKTLQRDGTIIERNENSAIVELNGYTFLVELDGDEFGCMQGSSSAFADYSL